MRASSILMIGFSGEESKQMRAVPTPDTNISRLNGFSCCIGEVIGKPTPTPSGHPGSQYYVCVKQGSLIQPGAIRTTGLTARQVENDGLDAFAGWWGVWSPWPAEVTERSHGFTGKVVSGKPVVVHHSEGQTGKPVSVLFRTDMAGRHMNQTNQAEGTHANTRRGGNGTSTHK